MIPEHNLLMDRYTSFISKQQRHKMLIFNTTATKLFKWQFLVGLHVCSEPWTRLKCRKQELTKSENHMTYASHAESI